MQGVDHAIADAGHNAAPLRTFVADHLAAAAQIKPIPAAPPIDWRLHKQRHEAECFNKPERFRRSAIRCEKTPPAFMGFAHLARATIWLR